MKRRRSLTAHQYGLGLIGLLGLLLISTAGWQAYFIHQDKMTYQAAQKIADKLNNYGNDDKPTVPASLAGVGIKTVPASIHYRKLSNTSYRFCISYHTATTNLTSLFAHTLTPDDTFDNYSGSTLYIPQAHHRGANCQTITPYVYNASATPAANAFTPYVKNSSGGYTVCGVVTNYFDAEGHVTSVTATSLTSSAISYPYTGAYQLSLFSAGSQVFDQKCNKLTPADLKVGDTVDVFDIADPATTSATSIFLKLD